MARLPELVLVSINVSSTYKEIEEGRERNDSLIADLLHEIALKDKRKGEKGNEFKNCM